MDKELQRALDRFFARMPFIREGGPVAKRPVRPALVAVTAENAAQFRPAPKRRGRPPKVKLSGNVVAFQRQAPAAAPDTDFVTNAMQNMAAVAKESRRAARIARGLPPDPPSNPIDDWFKAGCRAFLALPIGGRSSNPGDEPKGAA
jgi:hypothetical protein